MEKLGENAVSEINYRNRILEKQLRNIRNTVNGRGESYVPLITDERGNVTDEKVEQLICELICSLKRYKKSAQQQAAGLTEETEELYRCFLYCAILGIAQEDDFPECSLFYGLFEPAQTFADIVSMARSPYTVAFYERETLLLSETDVFGDNDFMQGFFGYTNAVYEMLTGNSVYHAYSEEEKRKVDERNATTLEASEEENERLELEAARSQGYETVEKYYAQFEGFRESCEEMENAWEEDLEAEQWEQDARLKKAALVNRIPNPDKYIQQYLRYRELYFQVKHKNIPSDIENMVDAYLYEHKISPFSFGEAYGLVLHKVKQFPGILKSEIRRARKIQ